MSKPTEQPKYTPLTGALSVIDQALNLAFTKGVYDRNDARVINTAMDVLAEAVKNTQMPPAGKEVKMKLEEGGKNAK